MRLPLPVSGCSINFATIQIWQLIDYKYLLRDGGPSQAVAHQFLQLGERDVGSSRDYERHDALPPLRIRYAHGGGLGQAGMGEEGVFNCDVLEVAGPGNDDVIDGPQ